MLKSYKIFFASLLFVLVLDQIIKAIFVNGFDANGSCISLNLTYNKGVAFSMFSFLGEKLKYIQIFLILSMLGYLILQKDILKKYALPAGLILGGGISNILDRFTHGGVVDYVYWHCGFDFAVFNFADVMIDLGVAIILWLSFKENSSSKHGYL